MLADFHKSLAMALEAKGRLRDALAEYRKSLHEHPDNVDALNNLAILLADRLDLPSRDPARAVDLANRVVELQPKDWRRWRTLGIVRYRAGEWKGAVSALEKAQQLLGRDDEIARLFLTMAHWRAGDREQARVCFDQARNLAKGNKPRGDLPRYRAEAADLVGKSGQPIPNSKVAQPPKK
jgi:Flp pilus assembly protein TadD